MATIKQKQAAELILENPGKSVSAAMREVGYSENTAKNPSDLTQSKSFREIMEKAGVTDEKISRVLDEGLQATSKEGDPDYSVRHKYLETAVKLKGHLRAQDDTSGDTYNTYIQQNNINPNTPEAKDMVDRTLDMLMEQTKDNG